MLYIVQRLRSLAYLRVDVHVLLQADGVPEGLPADVAAKGSGSTVRPPDVNLKPMGRREHLKQSQSVSGGSRRIRLDSYRGLIADTVRRV